MLKRLVPSKSGRGLERAASQDASGPDFSGLRSYSYSAAPLAAGDWTRFAEPVVLHAHGV